jgi:DNA helicase-2/ATP-dependent DNA helicase PcrA
MFGKAKDEDLSAADLASHAAGLRLRADATGRDSAEELADLADAQAELAGAYDRYSQLMMARGFIDHADQVALALRLLRMRPAIRASIASRFKYILVDELQDTNRSQLELVLALAGDNGNIMAVGDPNQGIYAFRGARSGNVDTFRATFPEAKTITLRRNYRSLPAIVEAAQRIVAANGQSDCRLVAQVPHRRPRGVTIRHLAFTSPEAEADGVATRIEREIRSGARPSDFAVLVRSNSEVGEFERSLRVRGIDVDTGSVVRLLDVPAVRSLVSFLRVVADQSNSLETYVLAAGQPYGLDGRVLAHLLGSSRRRNRSILDALTDAADARDPSLADEIRRRIRLLLDHVRTGVEISAQHTSGEVLYDYLHRSGMLARFAKSNDPAVEADARSVARFCELVRSRAGLLDEDRVPFFVASLELDRDISQEDADRSDRDAVRVITVHRAKGLEFGRVFVSCLVDGRFPVRSRASTLALPDDLVDDGVENDSLAEERRLFYVAVTRARDELTLTSHEFGPNGRGRRRPSIFISEAIDAPAAVISPPSAADAIGAITHALVAPAVADPETATDRSLTLSYSQIDEFLTCPERYRLRYDIGVPTPAHHALSYGTAIHQAIASFHTAQARGVTMSEDELVAELRRAWQPEGFLSREHEDARFAAGADALRRFRTQQIASGGKAPTAIERPFTFRLGRDELRGRIDRVDESESGAVITDYKSSDVRDQKRADSKARESLQLQVYALAHEAQTGDVPSAVQLHFVESGIVGRAEPTRERLDKAREKLLATAGQIRARNFAPKPSTIACGYCPFRSICSASAA